MYTQSPYVNRIFPESFWLTGSRIKKQTSLSIFSFLLSCIPSVYIASSIRNVILKFKTKEIKKLKENCPIH